MSTTLLITVGGSHQPIVTAIRDLKPERVIFVCSNGSSGSQSQVVGQGTPCEVRCSQSVKVLEKDEANSLIEHLGIANRLRHGQDLLTLTQVDKLPNIPDQLGLDNRFELVLIQNPDDLSECYRLITEKIRSVRQKDPDSQLLADYTGGTKTMSLALGLAAIDYGLSLFLTTSATRENLLKVERGESTERASVSSVTVERKIEQFLPIFLQQYNYPAVVAELRDLLCSLELPSEEKRRIRELLNCCAGLDAWDRFDHAKAWQLLEPQMKRVQQLGLFLKRVMSSRMAIDEKFQTTGSIPGHGYEIVEDLLLNAERRAVQERYDDAVGRIYRSLELLAQIRLQQTYKIKTGDVDVTKLPAELQEQYESKRSLQNSKIKLALRDSYELLSQLPDEPLGQQYWEQATVVLDALSVRNNSLFAHGFQPITDRDYQKVNQVLSRFIQAGISGVVPDKAKFQAVQFPTSLGI